MAIRQGWRFFVCDECGHTWHEASRDAASPSGDACAKCGVWCQPDDYEIDETVPVDEFKNLIDPRMERKD